MLFATWWRKNVLVFLCEWCSAEVLDTFEFTTSRDHHVTFRMDSNTPLLTKCELYDTNNNCFIFCQMIIGSIDVNSSWGYRSYCSYMEDSFDNHTHSTITWSSLVSLETSKVVMSFDFLWIECMILLWKCIIWFGCLSYSINEEDAEKLQLLKSVVVSPQRNDFDSSLEVRNTVQCQRCGFINSEKSTVCRECNALLKGNSFFISSQQARYY